MNPNPQLNLSNPRSSMTISTSAYNTGNSYEPDSPGYSESGRSNYSTPPLNASTSQTSNSSVVSWEDLERTNNMSVGEDKGNNASNTPSRNSRSGLSSPAIEPALSPINTSKSKISFNSTTSVITEAANRLRMQGNENDRSREGTGGEGGIIGNSPKVVMFSAQRRNIVLDTGSGNEMTAISPMSNASRSGAASPPNLELSEVDHNVTTGQQRTTFEENILKNSILPPPPPNTAANAAERLKKLIRRAESGGSRNSNPVSLEAAFSHFDQSHTGVITPKDLQEGLRKLGTSFEFDLDECRTLLQTLSKKETPTEGISLLGWYRALGRNSPPPREDELARPVMDLMNSPVIRSEDAANRLRDLVLRAELEKGTPLESSFQLFDQSGSGFITASDFHRALRSLQNAPNGSFDLDDDCCEELAALFDVNQDGQVSLLDFYRFMGRHSPPLKPSSNEDDDEDPSDFELDHDEDENEDEAPSSNTKRNNSKTEKLRAALEPIADNGTLRSIIKTLEVDRNKRVAGANLIKAINSSSTGASLTEDDANHLINMFVVDGEGDVCLYEFYRFMGRELDEEEDEEEMEVAEISQDGMVREKSESARPPSISPTLGERFKAAMVQANNSQADLTSILADCDYQGDGKVSVEDLRATMLNSGMFTSFSEDELQSILGMFDANDDGTVSLNEWYAAAGQTYDEVEAATSVFQRLLPVNNAHLDDAVRPLLSNFPDNSSCCTKADFESLVSSLDTLNNVPLKLIHTIANILSAESSDNVINISDVYKLFKHEFDPTVFINTTSILSNTSLSLSSTDLSDLPSSPESSKKKKKKKKSPSPRKSPSPKKRSPAKSPTKALKPISRKKISPPKSKSPQPSKSPSPKAMKKTSPKVSPVRSLQASPLKLPETAEESDDEYGDDDFDDDDENDGGAPPPQKQLEGSFENTDDVFLNLSSNIEGSYGEEDFEDEDDDDVKPKDMVVVKEEEEEEGEEDDEYGDEDDFDDYDPEDDKPKSCLKNPNKINPKKRNVKFLGKLVTSVRTRPKTRAEDVKSLYYTEEEITNFEDAAYIEEQRGMEPGSLDDRNIPMSHIAQMQTAASIEQDDPDALETFEDYMDDSFDKGGFGSDDDF